MFIHANLQIRFIESVIQMLTHYCKIYKLSVAVGGVSKKKKKHNIKPPFLIPPVIKRGRKGNEEKRREDENKREGE